MTSADEGSMAAGPLDPTGRDRLRRLVLSDGAACCHPQRYQSPPAVADCSDYRAAVRSAGDLGGSQEMPDSKKQRGNRGTGNLPDVVPTLLQHHFPGEVAYPRQGCEYAHEYDPATCRDEILGSRGATLGDHCISDQYEGVSESGQRCGRYPEKERRPGLYELYHDYLPFSFRSILGVVRRDAHQSCDRLFRPYARVVAPSG